MVKKFIFLLSLISIFIVGFIFTAYANENEKNLSVYYPNWAIYSSVHQRQQVRDLPWDRISVINHSFWVIFPNHDHTEFPIGPTDSTADFGTDGCFDQYAEMAEHYPDVKILLAIGGWGAEWFSDMALTEKGRKSFVDSCVDVLLEYPWMGGIDIDWEYPGTSRNWDEPGYHGRPEDMETFVLLMKELREAFDAAGLQDKILTFCTISSVTSLSNGSAAYDFMAAEPYIDRVNIMTYDMAGSWSRRAYHHTALHPGPHVANGMAASEVVEYMLSLGFPAHKINIGTPFYGKGWSVNGESAEEALGKTHRSSRPVTNEPQWFELKEMENSESWDMYYDEVSEGAVIFNTDPDSRQYQHFFSYENERSLQAKLDYIHETGIGGIIVWATSGDSIDDGYPLMSQIAIELGVYTGDNATYVLPEHLVSRLKAANPVGRWSLDYFYNPGDVVFYGSRIFKTDTNINPRDSEVPSGLSTIWQEIGELVDFESVDINIPAWKDARWYTGAVVKHANGYYIAIADTPESGGSPPDMDDAFWREFPEVEEEREGPSALDILMGGGNTAAAVDEEEVDEESTAIMDNDENNLTEKNEPTHEPEPSSGAVLRYVIAGIIGGTIGIIVYFVRRKKQ